MLDNISDRGLRRAARRRRGGLSGRVASRALLLLMPLLSVELIGGKTWTVDCKDGWDSKTCGWHEAPCKCTPAPLNLQQLLNPSITPVKTSICRNNAPSPVRCSEQVPGPDHKFRCPTALQEPQ